MTNTSSSLCRPPIILPSVGKPKWKRTFHSIDIKPISTTRSSNSNNNTINNSNSNNNNNSSHHTCCPICNNHEIRYTCPKCLVPFCSVECYRKHDLPTGINGNGNGDGGSTSANGGGTCTEKFYRGKVKEICHLDVQNEQNVTQMKDILTRSFYDNGDSSSNGDNNDENNLNYDGNSNGNDNGNDNGNGIDCLTEDELIELATHVLSIQDIQDIQDVNNKGNQNGIDIDHDNYENDDDFDNNNDNYDTIPQHLRLKFEQAVQRGELSHLITGTDTGTGIGTGTGTLKGPQSQDQYQSQWCPYWLPDHNGINTIHQNEKDNDNNGDDNNDDGDDDNHNHLLLHTLDERILSIPKLIKPQSTLSASSKRIDLQYNICEILYNTTWILRLLNADNAFNANVNSNVNVNANVNINYTSSSTNTNSNDKLHSALFLYSQSFVLSKDERYMNINEVCMDCTLKEGMMKNHSNNCRGSDIGTSYSSVGDIVNPIIIDWKVLLNDIICVCRNKRMVLRVLFDAIDILNDGYKSFKKLQGRKKDKKKESSSRIMSSDIGNMGNMGGISKKELKLAQKKIEYYTSWIVINWDIVGDDIVNDVRVWMNDWILKEEDRTSMNNVTMIGNIGDMSLKAKATKQKRNDGNVSKMSSQCTEPFLKAVSTKRLIKETKR